MEQTGEERAPSRGYEVAYLVSPSIPEDKVPESVNRVKTILEKRGAVVMSEEYPRFRQLAYTLVKPLGGKNEKYTSAYFGWIKFESEAAVLSDIKADLERETQLVRFLVVKLGRESKTRSRPLMWRKPVAKHEAPKTETKAVAGMTEAEIDKTIEELVVE